MVLALQKFDQAESRAELSRKVTYGEEVSDTELTTAGLMKDKDGNIVELVETDDVEESADEIAAREKAEADAAALAAKEKEEQGKDYKAMYSTLKGKYDKELPVALTEARTAKADAQQYQNQVAGLQSRITGLEAEIATLKTSRAALSDTDPDLEELETEFPTVAKLIKSEREAHKAEIKTLTDKITKLSTDVTSTNSRVASDSVNTFKSRMCELVGDDWETIDHDPAFIAWLQELVPYTLFTKLQFLQDAASKSNADSASKFFIDYKASLSSGNEEEVETEEVETDAQKKLRGKIAPASGPSGRPGTGVGAVPGFTLQDYRDFQDQTIRGKFNPKDPRWKGKTEAQLEAIFDNLASKGKLK